MWNPGCAQGDAVREKNSDYWFFFFFFFCEVDRKQRPFLKRALSPARIWECVGLTLSIHTRDQTTELLLACSLILPSSQSLAAWELEFGQKFIKVTLVPTPSGPQRPPPPPIGLWGCGRDSRPSHRRSEITDGKQEENVDWKSRGARGSITPELLAWRWIYGRPSGFQGLGVLPGVRGEGSEVMGPRGRGAQLQGLGLSFGESRQAH